MQDIHLNVKKATFQPMGDIVEIEIPSTAFVKLALYDNTRYHVHFYGHRPPKLVFEWRYNSFGSVYERIWGLFAPLLDKDGVVDVVDDQGKSLNAIASVHLWNDGDSPTLEFTLEFTLEEGWTGPDTVVLDEAKKEP